MIRRVALSISISVIAMLLLSTAAVAVTQKATIQLSVVAAEKLEQGYAVTVRVRTDDGKPVNDATIRFYESVDLFGAREMSLGSATTDGQGQATFLYLPAQLGSHQIVARFAGRDQVAAAEAETTFEASVAAPSYQPETVALSGFTQVVTVAVGIVVLTVWALIAFALISTARGVRRGARDLGPKGDLA
ncbi:MAG TPA: hypothetical protein VL333_03620 [Candidatus Saccharimonadales bacterium]|jgi:hypothetical protein|nr:hypothetical protein [Candidatus Saccharimonadales bacterium]